MCFTEVKGGVHLYVRSCTVHTPFLLFGNGWTHRAEISDVARDLLAMRFAQVMEGVRLHVRTCTPVFHISEINGRIVVKLRVLLETGKL